jgi:hypothetical protein
VDATPHLLHQNIKEKNLQEVIDLILEESSGRNPLHQRRIDLLRVKKEGSHSDFLFMLEEHMSLVEFNNMTKTKRQTIQQIESSTRNQGKGPRIHAKSAKRFCGDCDSSTHNKEDCWGKQNKKLEKVAAEKSKKAAKRKEQKKRKAEESKKAAEAG